jgi:hypothetical protein
MSKTSRPPLHSGNPTTVHLYIPETFFDLVSLTGRETKTDLPAEPQKMPHPALPRCPISTGSNSHTMSNQRRLVKSVQFSSSIENWKFNEHETSYKTIKIYVIVKLRRWFLSNFWINNYLLSYGI